jgi:hypothetical protein
MKIDQLNESELREILQAAQEGEKKLKEMSNHATIIAEKWRVRTYKLENNTSENESN